MVKRVTIETLVETIAKLKVGEGIKFFWNFQPENLNKEGEINELKNDYSEYLIGAYTISKLNYLDVCLLIIGGFGADTKAESLSSSKINNEESIRKILANYFNDEDSTWIKENNKVVIWLSDTIYSVSLKENF